MTHDGKLKTGRAKKRIIFFLSTVAVFQSGSLMANEVKAEMASKEKIMASDNFKRRGPKPVTPLVHNGVRYEVLRRARTRGFTQSGGIIAALDEKSGDELWTLQIYQTVFNNEETDVQEVYITDITLNKDDQSLIITNERKQRFMLNLQARQITAIAR